MRQQTFGHSLEEDVLIFGRDVLSPRINHLHNTGSPAHLRRQASAKKMSWREMSFEQTTQSKIAQIQNVHAFLILQEPRSRHYRWQQ